MNLLNRFSVYFLHKDWFSTRPKFIVVVLFYFGIFFLVLYFGSLLFSFDYQVVVGKDHEVDYLEALKLLGIFLFILT